MKNLFNKILKSLNFSGRDWAVLTLALLLAFSVWLIHNLSLKYNDYLNASVVARCNIDGHTDVSEGSSEVMAKCSANGFNIITSKIRGRRKSITIDFKPSEMRHKEGDTFYILSKDLHEYAAKLYGDDVSVDYFVTDTLFFRFPFQDYKRVPVHPVYSLSFKTQYMAGGELEVYPDTVTIYGEPFHLENITSVYTKLVKYSELSEDVQGMVRLEQIKGVRMSAEEVRYSVDVTRFVELRKTLQVKPSEVPADKEIRVFPASAEVVMKCRFPLLEEPSQDMTLIADYGEYQKSISGISPLQVLNLPRGVIEYEIVPPVVGWVVEDRQ